MCRIFASHAAEATLISLPITLSCLAVLLIAFGSVPAAAVAMLLAWRLLSGPISVAWNTWMARIIPDQLEAGGGLMVALMQFAITAGAFGGGMLFDTVGWQGPFVLAAIFLAASAVLATRATYVPKHFG